MQAALQVDMRVSSHFPGFAETGKVSQVTLERRCRSVVFQTRILNKCQCETAASPGRDTHPGNILNEYSRR